MIMVLKLPSVGAIRPGSHRFYNCGVIIADTVVKALGRP